MELSCWYWYGCMTILRLRWNRLLCCSFECLTGDNVVSRPLTYNVSQPVVVKSALPLSTVVVGPALFTTPADPPYVVPHRIPTAWLRRLRLPIIRGTENTLYLQCLTPRRMFVKFSAAKCVASCWNAFAALRLRCVIRGFHSVLQEVIRLG